MKFVRYARRQTKHWDTHAFWTDTLDPPSCAPSPLQSKHNRPEEWRGFLSLNINSSRKTSGEQKESEWKQSVCCLPHSASPLFFVIRLWQKTREGKLNTNLIGLHSYARVCVWQWKHDVFWFPEWQPPCTHTHTIVSNHFLFFCVLTIWWCRSLILQWKLFLILQLRKHTPCMFWLIGKQKAHVCRIFYPKNLHNSCRLTIDW